MSVASGAGDARSMRSSRWPRHFLIAAELLAAAARADGPAVEPSGGAAEIFDVVTVVASKVEERVGEIAGTATVVGREEMDRRLVQGAEDAVRYEPGVSATGQAGRFGFAGFRVRGIDGDRVSVELDGVPAPAAFAVGSFADAGRGLFEPELLRSVEILRGPASAPHGSAALGGVVALTTRSPADFLDGAAGGAWSARASADSRDRGLRTSLLGAAARGEWQALGLLVRRAGEELDNRGDVPPDPAASEHRSGFLRLVRTLDHGLLELTVDGEERTVEADVDHLERGPAQFATTERLVAHDRAERSRVSLQHQFAGSGGGLAEGRGRLYWSDASTVQATEQERGPDARTPHRTLRRRRFELGEETLGGEWTATSRFTAGSAEHRLVWGVEASTATVRERRDGSETNLASGQVSTVVLGETLPVRDFPVSDVRNLAFYAVDELVFGDVGRWRLLPALRFDRTTTDARPDRLYREDFPDTPAVDTDDASWSPKLALTRRLGRGNSVYAQYAEGFRAPPFDDVNVGLRITTFDFEAIPNPDLRPERSRGVELGWRLAGARASAHLALYDNRYCDLIESRANLGRDPATGTTIFQSVNRDRARIYGGEARLRIDLGRVAPLAAGWTADAAVAWAKGEDTRRGEPLNSVDPAKLTVGLAHAAASGRFAASAVGTLVDSKRGDVDNSTANVFAPPGYALLDLYGEWRPSRSWTLTLALLNVFDEKYWPYGDIGGVLADDPQLDFHTEPGRGLLVGIAFRR